jgi:uncharacterized protein
MVSKLKVNNMSCIGCEEIIVKGLKKQSGVQQVEADFRTNLVTITHNQSVQLDKLKDLLSALGYPVAESKKDYSVWWIMGLGLLLLTQWQTLVNISNQFPTVTTSMSLFSVLVVGLLTSLHCVAMCGGICLSVVMPTSQTANRKLYRASALYNLGRIISYTMVGMIVGGIGSVFSPSPLFKGLIMLLAGGFMIVMAVNMLGLLPKKLISVTMPQGLRKSLVGRSQSPLYVGLLNGLMPCGPLQAMQLYALSTGSVLMGGLSMFVFGLGTLPLMFGLGTIGSALNKRYTTKLTKLSAVLVLILGIGMASNGFSLGGFKLPVTNQSLPANEIVIQDNIQLVESTITARSYEPIKVKQGIPVRWTIKVNAEDLNGCNNAIIIPEYGIEYQLQPGDNIIEFTPGQPQEVPFTCWMGMIKSKIVIIE